VIYNEIVEVLRSIMILYRKRKLQKKKKKKKQSKDEKDDNLF